MDDSAALVIEQLLDLEKEEGIPCIIMGLQGAAASTLRSLNCLDNVPEDHYVADLEEARELAVRLLDG